MTTPSKQREFDEHRKIIRSLTKSGGPLDPRGPNATINNPAWFIRVTESSYPRASRADLYTRLIVEHRSRGSGSGDRQAIILAGPPGAGKTTVMKSVLGEGQHQYLSLDSDEFKRALLRQALHDGSYESFVKPAEVRDHEARGRRFFPLELASLVHEESSMIARLLRQEAVAAGENLVVDAVLSNVDKALKLGQELAEARYTVRVFDVEADYETCRARIHRRWRQARAAALSGEDDLGGRWVPSEITREVFSDQSGPALSADAAERLAHGCPAVTEFQRFWVADPDAAPARTALWRRPSPELELEVIRTPSPGN